MAPKMYLLVEADQSKDDPISKLMTQLVDQLKTTSKCPSEKTPPKCPSNKPADIAMPKCPSNSTEIVVNNQRAAITAEACVDPSGCTKAKFLVLAGKPNKEETCPKQSCPKELPACPVESTPCPRRNGLDPTFSEQRGQKKFQYLPLKSKIPDYDAKRCPKPLIISDQLSNASSCDYRIKLTAPVIKGLRETCAKSITEARLQKYGACVARKNGLQDQCDPLAKRVLRNCCKTAKKC